MEIEKIKSIIEAILFAAGRQVNIKELIVSLEMSREDIENIIEAMKEEYKAQERGIEIIKIEDELADVMDKVYTRDIYFRDWFFRYRIEVLIWTQ